MRCWMRPFLEQSNENRRLAVRSAIVTSTIMFCVGGVYGCAYDNGLSGSAAHRSMTAASSVYERRDRDDDNDNTTKSYYDSDDTVGHLATQSDRLAVAAVIKRYYAALAESNGAETCSLLYYVTMEATAEGDEGPGTEAYTSSAKACAAVVAYLSRQRHKELARDRARLEIVGVRVDGARGWVLLQFGSGRERRVLIHREGRIWKVDTLFDTKVP